MGDPERHLALVVRSVPFWQMAVSGVFFTVAVIGSLGSVVTFAQDDGLPARAAVALFTVIGFGSIVGRMALTSLARPLQTPRAVQQLSVFAGSLATCVRARDAARRLV